MFREVEAACQRGCFGRSGVSKILCIRQCISPSCYKELYLADLVCIYFLKKCKNLDCSKSKNVECKVWLLICSWLFHNILYNIDVILKVDVYFST